MAQLYHAYENNEYNITGCGNFGNIYGQIGNKAQNCANDSAGILGNVTTYEVNDEDKAQRFTIRVLDCVNGPGVKIYSGSMASGIVGFLSVDPWITADSRESEIAGNRRACFCRTGNIYGSEYEFCDHADK